MFNVKEIFALNLKRIRKKLGLSQEKLADMLGMQFRSISNLETAKYFISSDNLNKICNKLNILPSEFFKINPDEVCDNDKEKIKAISALINACNSKKLDLVLSLIKAIDGQDIK